MAQDLKTQYVIELLEQGTGAKTAVADLKSVSAAAKETTAATETMTAAAAASSAGFTVSAGQMKTAARTLSADLKLLALVSFPEVAAKGFALEAALKAVASTSFGETGVLVTSAACRRQPWMNRDAAGAWRRLPALSRSASRPVEA